MMQTQLLIRRAKALPKPCRMPTCRCHEVHPKSHGSERQDACSIQSLGGPSHVKKLGHKMSLNIANLWRQPLETIENLYCEQENTWKGLKRNVNRCFDMSDWLRQSGRRASNFRHWSHDRTLLLKPLKMFWSLLKSNTLVIGQIEE